MGAAMSASLTVIGDKLGLYKALHEHGPLTSAELAQHTKTHERYVREWLAAQAAGGYVEYDPPTRRFTLPPEQAFMLADESSPLYVQGAFQMIEAAMADEPHITPPVGLRAWLSRDRDASARDAGLHGDADCERCVRTLPAYDLQCRRRAR